MLKSSVLKYGGYRSIVDPWRLWSCYHRINLHVFILLSYQFAYYICNIGHVCGFDGYHYGRVGHCIYTGVVLGVTMSRM